MAVTFTWSNEFQFWQESSSKICEKDHEDVLMNLFTSHEVHDMNQFVEQPQLHQVCSEGRTFNKFQLCDSLAIKL